MFFKEQQLGGLFSDERRPNNMISNSVHFDAIKVLKLIGDHFNASTWFIQTIYLSENIHLNIFVTISTCKYTPEIER